MCITNPLKISDFQGNLLHMLLFSQKHAFYFSILRIKEGLSHVQQPLLQFVKEPHHQAAQQPSAASKIQKYFPKACKQRRFHAQFASFFRFMAANLSFTQFVT